MAESMWPQVGGPGDVSEKLVDESAHGPRVDAAASRAEEQGGTARRAHRCGTRSAEPALQRLDGRNTDGHPPLLVALAEHAEHSPRPVDVVDVEAAQLADPDAAGIEHFEHRNVAHAGRALVVGSHGGKVEQ